MPTPEELQSELERLETLDAAQNEPVGRVYPADSLHAKGAPSPSCPHCRRIAELRYRLQVPDKLTKRPRLTPNITQSELRRWSKQADSYATGFIPDALPNNVDSAFEKPPRSRRY